MNGLVKIFTASAADLLDEWFESEEVKVTLATDGVIGANGGPRSPGTAYILLHHVMGSVGGKRGLVGIRARRHGSGFECDCRFGPKPRCCQFEPSWSGGRIQTVNGRVRGVVLESGEEIGRRWWPAILRRN